MVGFLLTPPWSSHPTGPFPSSSLVDQHVTHIGVSFFLCKDTTQCHHTYKDCYPLSSGHAVHVIRMFLWFVFGQDTSSPFPHDHQVMCKHTYLILIHPKVICMCCVWLSKPLTRLSFTHSVVFILFCSKIKISWFQKKILASYHYLSLVFNS